MGAGGEVTAGQDRIRVAFVNDHPSITHALRVAAEATDDLRVVGVARTCTDALALATRTGDDVPGVVVTDIQLAGEAEGLRLLEAVGKDGPVILLLSSFDRPPLLRTAFDRGAAGYLVMTAKVRAILDAVAPG